MPYVNVQMLEGRTEEQKARIAEAITKALVEHGNANAQSTFVVFEDVKPQNWASGGRLVSLKDKAPG
ncbi:MAG: 4-oxalocrotonate tautomerase [Lautropia sp. SCN 66-9]|nr:MAG: 4-oxalocrotonate tautomerase [Lautropia sp. SCN 66-9]